MTLGQALKKCRKKAGSTIRDVQDATNLNNICRYENDVVQPSFKAVIKLSRYYNVNITELAKAIPAKDP